MTIDETYTSPNTPQSSQLREGCSILVLTYPCSGIRELCFHFLLYLVQYEMHEQLVQLEECPMKVHRAQSESLSRAALHFESGPSDSYNSGSGHGQYHTYSGDNVLHL